jgi:hypothetical protein
MAYNFPDSPTTGQIYNASPGVSFVYSGVAWARAPVNTALPKNYVINGNMLSSMQMGSAVGAASASHAGYYAADQFLGQWALTGSTMGMTRWDGQNVNTGSKTVYLTNNTIITPAATDYAMISTFIEGQRVADLMWGTPQAVPVVLRFSMAANAGAGPYSIRVSNSAGDRSYLAAFTAASWSDIVIPIPGDTTGTWLTDTGMGMRINWICAAGSSWVGIAGWQAGNKLSLPGQFNGLSASGGTSNFHLNSVGLFADPYKTGVAPPHSVRSYAVTERKGLRYWYPSFGTRGVATAATATGRSSQVHPAPLRIAPLLANCTIVGTPRAYDGGVDQPLTSIAAVSANTLYLEMNLTASAGGMTAGRRCIQYNFTPTADPVTNYIAVNVRMT